MAIGLPGIWITFLIWVTGKYGFAIDLEFWHEMEIFWVFNFTPFSLGALIGLFVYIGCNIRQKHLGMLYALMGLLAQIISVFVVLNLEKTINREVFLRIKNQSSYGTLDIKLCSNWRSISISDLKSETSTVIHYRPYFEDADDRAHQLEERFSLFIFYNNKVVDSIQLEEVHLKGNCYRYLLGKEFQLKKEL